MSDEQSLNQTLSALGFSTTPASAGWSIGCKHIRKDGKIVFTGDAREVWQWLRK